MRQGGAGSGVRVGILCFGQWRGAAVGWEQGQVTAENVIFQGPGIIYILVPILSIPMFLISFQKEKETLKIPFYLIKNSLNQHLFFET